MPKAKTLKCPKCDRMFMLPLHLARHMSATHRSGPAPKKRGRPRGSRRSVAPTPHAGGLPGQLLAGIQAWRAKLAAQQDALNAQLAALDQLSAALGTTAPRPVGRPPGRRVGRPPGRPAGRRVGRPPGRPASKGRSRGTAEGSLKWHVERVLRGAGKPMRVAEIAAAVLKGGYTTKDKNLAHTVGAALKEMRGARKVTRGVYQLR